MPRSIAGAEPSTGANRAASGNIVPAVPNAGVTGVSNGVVDAVSVVAGVSNQDGDDMAAASASGIEEAGSCSVL